MAFILGIVDGTGPYSDTEYATSMANSFCKQTDRQCGMSSQYWRGPAAAGMDVLGTARSVRDWIVEKRRTRSDADVMLMGYSRGASIVIMTAEYLNELNVPVHSLWLFDAVARHVYTGGEVIPANVAYSRHAVRTDDAEMIRRYEGSIGVGQNPMRPSFGHTGMTAVRTPNGDHQHRIFRGSHGALGGVGWGNVEEDPACQREIAGWMNRCFQARGLPVTLTAVDPPAAPITPRPPPLRAATPTEPLYPGGVRRPLY